MTDLIKRQDAVDALQKEINKGIPPFNDVIGSIRCGVRLARNIIEDLPSAQQWIPCSERLPERRDKTQMRGYYLTTNAYGSVGLKKYEFEGGGLGYAWDSDIRIVAWMPLPSPYIEETES